MVESGRTSKADAKAAALEWNEEVEAEDEDGPGERSSGGGLEFTPGKPPKKRLVSKVVARLLGSFGENDPDEAAVLVEKLVGWLHEGKAPPKILSPHLRAVLNEAKKK